jgi:TrwC relaxase
VRADGRGNEIKGVTQAQMDACSTRTVQVREKERELARAWEREHGRAPASRELLHIANDVTLQSRRRKDACAVDWDALAQRWDSTLGGELVGIAPSVSDARPGHPRALAAQPPVTLRNQRMNCSWLEQLQIADYAHAVAACSLSGSARRFGGYAPFLPHIGVWLPFRCCFGSGSGVIAWCRTSAVHIVAAGLIRSPVCGSAVRLASQTRLVGPCSPELSLSPAALQRCGGRCSLSGRPSTWCAFSGSRVPRAW